MSALQKLNYVKNLFRHPCGTPTIDVVVITAFEATLPILFSLNQFSCLDILKSRAGISWKCGRALKAAAKQWHNPKIIDRTHFLYSLGSAQLERALWIWFVADLAVDFFANWSTLMYLEQACTLPPAGHVSIPLSSIFTGGGGTVFINGTAHRECFIVGGNAWNIPFGCDVTVTYQCEWRPFHDLPVNMHPVTTWIEDDLGRKYGEVTGSVVNPDGSRYTGGGMTIPKGSPFAQRSYRIRFEVGGGLMGCVSGNLSISGYGKAIPLIGVSCNPGGRFAGKHTDSSQVVTTSRPKPGIGNPR